MSVSLRASRIAVVAFLLALAPAFACGDKASSEKAHDAKTDDDDKQPRNMKGESSAVASDGSAGPNAAPSAPAAIPRAEVVVDQAAIDAFLADENAKLTQPVYESLVAALGACELTESGVDYKCPAKERLQKAHGRKNFYDEAIPLYGPVSTKLIGHDKPAVRAEAAELFRWALDMGKDAEQIVVDGAKKEAHPTVLKAMIKAVGSKVHENDAVRGLVMQSADHESAQVRTEALGWLLWPSAKTVSGGFDKAVERLEKDPDEGVRIHVCTHLYGTEEERAVEILEKYLADKSLPQEIRAGCLEGMTRTWTGSPAPKRPSAKGYELTMKVLEQTPRDKDNPPWRGMDSLVFAKTEPDAIISKDWIEAVKPFYKRERLVAAIEAIVLDKDASYLARTSGLNVLRSVGEKKSVFEALAKKLAGGKGQDDADVKTRAEETGSKL